MIYSKAFSYTVQGMSYYGKGFFEETLRHLPKGAEFCERINNPIWDFIARYCLGDAYFEMGEYQKSQNYYKEAVSILEQNSLMPSFSNLCKIGLARVKVMNN